MPPSYTKHGTRLFISFFFNDTATTEIYTLSLHDALPISAQCRAWARPSPSRRCSGPLPLPRRRRSEEHTSELQSRQYLVCRLLLEKKNIPLSITSSEIGARGFWYAYDIATLRHLWR